MPVLISMILTNRPLSLGEITLTPMGGWLTYFTPEALDVMGREIRVNKNKK